MAFSISTIAVEAEVAQGSVSYNRPPLQIQSIALEVEVPFKDAVWYRPAFEIRSIGIEIGDVPFVYQRTIQIIS